MNRRAKVLAAGMLVFTSACYHATVETGLTPGTETVEKKFAASWIHGLVPPSTVSTAAQCRTGVARVETQLSFVNMLVGAITFGIFTPMHIKATCAAARTAADAPPSDLAVREGSAPATWSAVFARAADLASQRGSATVEIVPSPK